MQSPENVLYGACTRVDIATGAGGGFQNFRTSEIDTDRLPQAQILGPDPLPILKCWDQLEIHVIQLYDHKTYRGRNGFSPHIRSRKVIV